MFRIPKSYMLGGSKIKVIQKEILGDGRNLGLYYSQFGRILLSKKSFVNDSVVNVEKSALEITFCHEMIHSILIGMGEYDLNKDERFIEGFATLLHQALSTQKGEI